jgi:hypothetical protein
MGLLNTYGTFANSQTLVIMQKLLNKLQPLTSLVVHIHFYQHTCQYDNHKTEARIETGHESSYAFNNTSRELLVSKNKEKRN